jgi:DNA-binding NarL/FixJ family response regulator
MKQYRILLAEDHTLVRAGFRALLKDLPALQVVAEAGDGREALQLISEHHPDVVLMDITMPTLNGLEATARATREFPYVRVIILSVHANEEYVLEALRAGASGYLLKDAGTSELEMAIKTVCGGEVYLSPAISKHVAEYIRRTGHVPRSDAEDSVPYKRLTPRQSEVLQLIAEGRTTKQIAHLLNISIKTAETHRTRLMEQLNIHDVAGLVRYAIRLGIVTSTE